MSHVKPNLSISSPAVCLKLLHEKNLPMFNRNHWTKQQNYLLSMKIIPMKEALILLGEKVQKDSEGIETSRRVNFIPVFCF